MAVREADIAIACIFHLTLEQKLFLAKEGHSCADILKADRSFFQRVGGLPKNVIWNARQVAARYTRLCKWLDDGKGNLVFYWHSAYPELLRTIDEAPFALSYQGSLKGNLLPSISVVGTRKATTEALHCAYTFATKACVANNLVISGFAWGVDQQAHHASVHMGKPTWAVLGSGLNHIYPNNMKLAQSILENGGALLSEFHPDSPPAKWHFPWRNRLIAALSPALVVVQAPLRSGAMVTADHALRQGREVFVHRIGLAGISGEGTARLAEDGAKIISSYDEFVHLAGMPYRRAL